MATGRGLKKWWKLDPETGVRSATAKINLCKAFHWLLWYLEQSIIPILFRWIHQKSKAKCV